MSSRTFPQRHLGPCVRGVASSVAVGSSSELEVELGWRVPWDLGSQPRRSLEAGNAWWRLGAEVLMPMDQNVLGLRWVSIRGTARMRAFSLGEAHTATVQPGPARAAPCPLHSQSPGAGAEPGSWAWLLGENTGDGGRRAWEATCRKRLPDRAQLALPLAPSPSSSGF